MMARTYSTEDNKVKQILTFDESHSHSHFNGDNNVSSRPTHFETKDALTTKAVALLDNSFVKLIAGLLTGIIIWFIYTNFFGQVNWAIVDDISEDSELDRPNNSDDAIKFWDTFLWKLCKAAIYGIAVVVFTWMITYMDSVQPGINPPTPVSPRKLRDRSGHTFHMGYVMAFVNGFAMFAMTLWYSL